MRAVVLCALFLVACTTTPPPQRFEGVWEWGFEHNRFRAQGDEAERWQDSWCLEVSRAEFRRLLASAPKPIRHDPPMRVRVIVEGRVIEAGPPLHLDDGLVLPNGFGHRGLCQHQIAVTRVVESQYLGLLEY
ncbi:MAG: hypothetical protein WDM79_16010 [Terricaulis sp.]